MTRFKETRVSMGMPITIELLDSGATKEALEDLFSYFHHVDEIFSPYKPESPVSRISRGELLLAEASAEVQDIYQRAQITYEESHGYFDIRTPNGTIDPSGIVKGWAVHEAAARAHERGITRFCIDAGGDVATGGTNSDALPWSVGIRHPFAPGKIAKVVYPKGHGVATSGTYIRGRHIYNPKTNAPVETPFVSLTVIGPTVYDADRFATAAFAMGEQGPAFIETLSGYEGYAITQDQRAFFTQGFDQYTYP
ncbi:MAG: hypothetical protein B7X04_03175 [Parcubacteria group bacterium 21-54-25]|nr:MAG: hypothetical protein B7X04_03175 [Parcubacteria group bacterium 21-54-25]HQU07991.1 FAD:protein FMN transferase [Candidatus Paceibacterota bacterium]